MHTCHMRTRADLHMNKRRHPLGVSRRRADPPLDVEDEPHYEELCRADPGKLFVVLFHAAWCGPCRAFAPLFRRLALQTHTARFLKVDIEWNDGLATRYKVKSLPTIKFVRGGNVVSTIEGLQDDFMQIFYAQLEAASTPQEVVEMRDSREDLPVQAPEAVAQGISVGYAELCVLGRTPLASLHEFVDIKSRVQRGQPPVRVYLCV
jgi:thiol-disulfide isomerase/thioredoxin